MNNDNDLNLHSMTKLSGGVATGNTFEIERLSDIVSF